jgi:TBC1 domain family member 15
VRSAAAPLCSSDSCLGLLFLRNFDVGYVQGMNDLLSPILFMFQGDEAEAFWCFVALMRSRAALFDSDQAGMTQELEMLGHALRLVDADFFAYLASVESANCYFAYRWFLCLFKRELTFRDTLRLWEVLWSRHLTDRMQTFVAVALIMSMRDEIMTKRLQFDEILQLVNAHRLADLDAILADAERYYLLFHRRLATAPLSHVAQNVRKFFDC